MSVLGDRDIASRFDEIFESDTADRTNIRAAKYYLTLGDRFLILPSGKRFGESGRPCRKGFVLQPGQTALVSTRERLSIPVDLSAIFGPIFDLSDSGILFFGGMLVDPGFGGVVNDNGWCKAPEPLSFYMANVGSQPYAMHPRQDHIASIAFVEVTGPYMASEFEKRLETSTARDVRAELFAEASDAPPDKALGLVEDVRDMRQIVDKFEASTKQIVQFGVIVLAITLFAAIVSILVSEGGKQIVLSLSLKDTLAAAAAMIAVPIGFTVAFYVFVCGLVKLRSNSQGFKGKRRQRAAASA